MQSYMAISFFLSLPIETNPFYMTDFSSSEYPSLLRR